MRDFGKKPGSHDDTRGYLKQRNVSCLVTTDSPYVHILCNVGPSYKLVYNSNKVICILNHNYWSYVLQLSYLGV